MAEWRDASGLTRRDSVEFTEMDGSSSRSAWLLVIASALLLAAGPAAAQQITTVSLVVNDLAYDPVGGLLYASLPSGATANPNTIAVIDASNGAVVSYVPVGNGPNRMAISDNGRYLYVGLDGAGIVRQVDLQTKTAGPQFTLPSADPYCSTPLARALAVQPGHDTVVAVTRGCSNMVLDVSVYDVDATGGVQRSAFVSSRDIVSLAFGSAAELYGYDSYTTGRRLSRLAVSASGVGLVESVTAILDGPNDISVAAGRIYAPAGQVVDAATFRLLGTFPFPGYSGDSPAVLPDPAAGRVLFVQNSFSPAYTLTLQSYDTASYLQAWSFSLGGTFESVSPRHGEGRCEPAGLQDEQRHFPGGLPGLAAGAVPAAGRQGRHGHGLGRRGVRRDLLRCRLHRGCRRRSRCQPDRERELRVGIRRLDGRPRLRGRPVGDDAGTHVHGGLLGAGIDGRRAAPCAADARPGLRSSLGYLYASVAGVNGSDGNSVVAIDPVTGNTVGTPVWVGSEPATLALTDDRRYLYVALKGAYSISRLDFPGLGSPSPFRLTPGFLDFSIGALRAQPGNSDVLLVSHGSTYLATGIEVYDHGTVRPLSFMPDATLRPGTALAFATASDVVYTRDWDKLVSATITANGLENAQAGQAGAFESSSEAYRLTFGNNRFYGDKREIVDASGARVTMLTGVLTSLVLPGAGTSPLLYLAVIPSGGDTQPRSLAAYDDGTLASLWTAALPAGTEYGGEASDLVRIADNVIAFRTATGVFIVDTTRTSWPLLTVAKSGTGTGKITAASLIDCGTICGARFTPATVVTMTAIAASGSKFTGWTGDADCADGTVTMSAARSCTAAFTSLPVFTNDPIVPGVTPVRAVHITELRTRIGQLRTRYGLGAYAWTDSSLIVGATPVQAAHVAQLRAALADVYTAAGLPTPVYTTSPITAGETIITATDIMELRAAVNAIW